MPQQDILILDGYNEYYGLGTSVPTDSKKGFETMPKKLHRAVNKIKKKGHSESSAYAIANAALKKKRKGKKK